MKNKLLVLTIMTITVVSCNNLQSNIVGGSWTNINEPSDTYRFFDDGEIQLQYIWEERDIYNQGNILDSHTIIRKGKYSIKNDSIKFEFDKLNLPSRSGAFSLDYKFEGIVLSSSKEKINMTGKITLGLEEINENQTIELVRN